VYSAASILNNLVTNSISGLNHTSNCQPIADGMRYFYNAFCINFLYQSVQLGICCLVLMALMIAGILTGSVFGVRYGRIEVERKLVAPENIHIQELHS
jgi:hypothetical protein